MTTQRIVVAYILVATDVQQLWRKEERGGGMGRKERGEGVGEGGRRGRGEERRGEKGRSLRVLTHKLMSI